MNPLKDILFKVKSTKYDTNYQIDKNTRASTNFANFARDPGKNKQRIGLFIELVNQDLNHILGDGMTSSRYEIRLEILSVFCHIKDGPNSSDILFTEVMRASVLDQRNGCLYPGPTGLNFSSYLRDYDFRVVLPGLVRTKASSQQWASFGKLHGLLTRLQFGADGVIKAPLAVCISIAQNHDYVATDSQHPILGREYLAESSSLTDRYFAQMGLRAQFFRPEGLPAPLAFYCSQVLQGQTDFYMASLIAVMANFQRIYRPEIYLSRTTFSSIPGEPTQASLNNQNHDKPILEYDRLEREQLAEQQASLIEDCLLMHHGDWLNTISTTVINERG